MFAHPIPNTRRRRCRRNARARLSRRGAARGGPFRRASRVASTHEVRRARRCGASRARPTAAIRGRTSTRSSSATRSWTRRSSPAKCWCCHEPRRIWRSRPSAASSCRCPSSSSAPGRSCATSPSRSTARRDRACAVRARGRGAAAGSRGAPRASLARWCPALRAVGFDAGRGGRPHSPGGHRGHLPWHRRLRALCRARAVGDACSGARATLLLVDCGEGTQRQLLRSTLGLTELDAILFTHFHADHVLGLPGLLKTYDLHGRAAPARADRPARARRPACASSRRSSAGSATRCELREVRDGDAVERDGYRLRARARAPSRPVARLGARRGRPPRRVRRARSPTSSACRTGPSAGALLRGDGRDARRTAARSRPSSSSARRAAGRSVVLTGDTRALQRGRRARGGRRPARARGDVRARGRRARAARRSTRPRAARR